MGEDEIGGLIAADGEELTMALIREGQRERETGDAVGAFGEGAERRRPEQENRLVLVVPVKVIPCKRQRGCERKQRTRGYVPRD